MSGYHYSLPCGCNPTCGCNPASEIHDDDELSSRDRAQRQLDGLIARRAERVAQTMRRDERLRVALALYPHVGQGKDSETRAMLAMLAAAELIAAVDKVAAP